MADDPSGWSTSVVAFTRLTGPQIDAYLAGDEWQGKAGGYAIQGQAAAFVRFLSGSYSNVVGLPLFETAQLAARRRLAGAVTTRILAAASPGEVRVAVVRDDELLDYAIWRPGAPDGVGDLYRGRVTARAPALGGAFVALGGADGFLPDTEGGKAATEGTVLGVRVTRAAQGGKGPRLSARSVEKSAGEGG